MVKGKNDGKPPKPPEFLVKLRKMLLDESSEVIEYKSGRIYFHNPQKLLDGILRKYFKHNNFSSLHRQLNYFEYMKVKGKGTVEPCMYENTRMLGKDINRLLLLKRKKPSDSGSKGYLNCISTTRKVDQKIPVNKDHQQNGVEGPPREQNLNFNDGKQCVSRNKINDIIGTPKRGKPMSAWPPTPTNDGDPHNCWAVRGGLTPKLASCPSDLDTKHQESNRRMSGNVMGFSRDWSWNKRAKIGNNSSKGGGVNHFGMYQMQENSYGVGMPAAQVTDLVDGSGSDEWKLREAMNEVDKMHLQRLLDVKRVEKSLLDSQLADMQKLFSPARLPYSPQIAQSSSGRNCVNPDQALVKAGNPSQGFSLPLDSTTNVTSAKNTGANSLPYMSPEGIYYHQASPQYSGSDNSSLEKDHQIGAFLMSLGWGESGDVNLPNSGGAPKSSVEAPQYPSTCTLTTPAALRSLVGVLQNNTDELLITPSTLACLEDDRDILQSIAGEDAMEEFICNQFNSPFFQRGTESSPNTQYYPVP